MQTPTHSAAIRCVSHVRHMLLTAKNAVVVRHAVVVAVLLASACGPASTDGYDCVHASGLSARLPADAPECKAFQDYVTAALDVYAARLPDTIFHGPYVADTLRFYRVERDDTTDPAGAMVDYEPQYGRVSGLTWCDQYRKIVVNYYSSPYSSLAHEIVHALERCEDPKHRTWEARGIFAAIDEITYSPNPLTPRPGQPAVNP